MDHSKLIATKSFLQTNPITIGIDENFLFALKLANGTIINIKDDTGVYLLKLLSIDFIQFRREIDEMIDNTTLSDEKNSKIRSSFPYEMIVRTALNSDRDHWIELSIPWIVNLGKEKFEKEISNIQKNKNISQNIRHKLLKL